MQVKLLADGRPEAGGSPLLMHNERLIDPLDSCTQAIAEVTGKRKKALEDYAEIGRREFIGALYTDPPIEWPLSGNNTITPAVPAWNLLRCLQDGAKRHKRGADVLRGCTPVGAFGELVYDGPRDPVELWKAGGFSLRKSVGVQRSRVIRTRPLFIEWQTSIIIEVDPTVWDLHTLRLVWADAGKYVGLGDMRPIYGRFLGTIREVDA